jgi:hypothetical protein
MEVTLSCVSRSLGSWEMVTSCFINYAPQLTWTCESTQFAIQNIANDTNVVSLFVPNVRYHLNVNASVTCSFIVQKCPCCS